MNSNRDYSPEVSKALMSMRELTLAMEEGGNLDADKVRCFLANETRREHVKRLANAKMPQREIAKLLGVSQAQVSRDLNFDTNGSEKEEKANKNSDGEAIFDTNVSSEDVSDDSYSPPYELDRLQKQNDALREQLEILKTPVIKPAAKKYDVIVIDPPWDMKKIERTVRPNQVEFDYPTMDTDALLAFRSDFQEVAGDHCHVFMWTTHKFLPLALRLFDNYGIKYVLTMVWHKPGGFQPVGLPQYNCEFAIYGRIGSPKFVDTKAFNCCFTAGRAEHSRKPDEFYDLVRRVTDGDRIDIFSREKRDGFDQFGNETSKFGDAA